MKQNKAKLWFPFHKTQNYGTMTSTWDKRRNRTWIPMGKIYIQLSFLQAIVRCVLLSTQRSSVETQERQSLPGQGNSKKARTRGKKELTFVSEWEGCLREGCTESSKFKSRLTLEWWFSTIWRVDLPFHRGHLRPSAYQIFTLWFITVAKLQLWSSNALIF